MQMLMALMVWCGVTLEQLAAPSRVTVACQHFGEHALSRAVQTAPFVLWNSCVAVAASPLGGSPSTGPVPIHNTRHSF